MSLQENKDLVRRYFDAVWNKGELQREGEFIAPDLVTHGTVVPGLPPGSAGLNALAGMLRASLPDLHVTTDVLFGDGDKVVQIWTLRGIHRGGSLFGQPASGNDIVLTGMSIYRVASGRIAERWSTLDLTGLMQQVGLAPAQAEELSDLRKGWYM
jgi:predicted ester cyclase